MNNDIILKFLYDMLKKQHHMIANSGKKWNVCYDECNVCESLYAIEQEFLVGIGKRTVILE